MDKAIICGKRFATEWKNYENHDSFSPQTFCRLCIMIAGTNTTGTWSFTALLYYHSSVGCDPSYAREEGQLLLHHMLLVGGAQLLLHHILLVGGALKYCYIP